MNYSETYFELDSEEATHCDHCQIIYIKGHVETVDTKDQSIAIVYCVWYLVVDTVDMKIKACNALNAMFVETVDTTVKTHTHIPAHNFLNIQPIFNVQKVLES